MKIILDERENSLYQHMSQYDNFDFIIEKKVIELGDVHFVKDDKEIIILERKSVSDLLASIKDGRYEEQSHRLIHSSGLYRHHIIYMIEGLFSQLKDEREKKMVYSAIATLQLYKGFNVVRTYSVQDSAEYILYTAHKIKREIERNNMPWTPDTLQKEEPINYCNFVKKTKKDNITPENIGEIILSQIPGISNVSACAIMNKFQSLPNLIDNLRNDPMCLNDIVCESKGKARKLSKNVSENIFKFLQ